MKEFALLFVQMFFMSIGFYYIFFDPTHYWKTVIWGVISSIIYVGTVSIVKYRIYKSNVE